MRASLSRWSWTMMAVFFLVSAGGCKSGVSMPGAEWLSWGKRPSTTTLSSNTYPQKPSAGALPNPSATTSGAASYPSFNGSGYAANQASTSGAANGYYTGPYGTNGAPPNAAGKAGFAASTYQASANGKTGASYASAPYQSPYPSQASPAGAGGSSYATADLRNSYSKAANPAAAGNSYGGAQASNWGANQWSGGSDSYNAQTASPGHAPGTAAAGSYPQTQSYPTTSPQANSYQSTSQPTYGAAAAAAGNYSAASTTQATNTGLSQNGGAYRPGSTARNSAQLPGQTGPAATTASQGGTYRGSTYPAAGGYPSTSGQY